MFQDSTPPLFRGIGTTVILVATVISFAMARHPASPLPVPGRSGMTSGVTPRVAELEREVDALRREVADDHFVEEVFGNPWFEILGFIGTGFIGASFYIEWGLRRRKARV
jgi:hypothetical protein